MQREPCERVARGEVAVERTFAVRGVAQNGVGDVLEVPPRLMVAHREQLHRDELTPIDGAAFVLLHAAFRIPGSVVLVPDPWPDVTPAARKPQGMT